ncbi:hypothetical protein JOF56_005712 [Kibdelosporangium banguiense]|uniref:Phage tail protein n=1 Tax=Kibdelosporangium banguiense TaxID=1365924 RepID=A0ABS4TLM4_9PSEU|nr:phage tail tube protein [Kibdelosporangium banguiense]MBP2325327.1 hypothetical protein [Kibdelosporangium banguiense]
MAPTGTGLSAQLGIGEEATIGTAVAPTRFLPFTKESLAGEFNTVRNDVLQAGGQYRRASQDVRTTRTAKGSVELPVTDRSFSVVWKHALGGTPVITDTAPTGGKIHRIQPAPLGSKSLTIQKGVPEPVSGYPVAALNYIGARITEWTLGVKVNDLLRLKLDLDAWDEVPDAPALAVANYPPMRPFHFAQCTIKAGGTASTTNGIVSVTGGTRLNRVTGFELKGTNPMATDRFFLGASGLKDEQIENDFRDLTLSLDAEFNRTQVYDAYRAGTWGPVQITFTGGLIATGVNAALDIILPGTRFESNPVQVDGPDIVEAKADLVIESDDTNVPIQVTYTTADTVA